MRRTTARRLRQPVQRLKRWALRLRWRAVRRARRPSPDYPVCGPDGRRALHAAAGSAARSHLPRRQQHAVAASAFMRPTRAKSWFECGPGVANALDLPGFDDLTVGVFEPPLAAFGVKGPAAVRVVAHVMADARADDQVRARSAGSVDEVMRVRCPGRPASGVARG